MIKQKLVVYGLGKMGYKIIKSISDNEYIDIVAVSDKISFPKFECGNREYAYCERDYLNQIDFDYLLITSSKYYSDIKNDIMAYLPNKEQRIISLKDLNRILVNQENFDYECNVCGSKVFNWIESGEDYELFHKKTVVGAGIRKSLCPVCLCGDRLRYEYEVLKTHTDIFESTGRILHFASEKQFEEMFRKSSAEYITADICEGRGDVIEDITALSFEDETFDWIIFNHVLEHVDEKKALYEVLRCLKHGGKAIITVPICWDVITVEDDSVISEEDRIKWFGQSDHLRLYGSDTKKRIEKAGFVVTCYKNDNDSETASKHAWFVNDAVFVCEKI